MITNHRFCIFNDNKQFLTLLKTTDSGSIMSLPDIRAPEYGELTSALNNGLRNLLGDGLFSLIAIPIPTFTERFGNFRLRSAKYRYYKIKKGHVLTNSTPDTYQGIRWVTNEHFQQHCKKGLADNTDALAVAHAYRVKKDIMSAI